MKARRKATHIDPATLAGRRRTGRILVVAASAVAMFASGWGMWTFFADLPTLNHWYLILPMFLLFDLAAVACAWNARINRLAYGTMGTEGWLVWLFATLSGLMSASDTDGRAAFARFAAPMVAAILFELLIRGERRDLTATDTALTRLRRRTLARFGLLDDVDQDDEHAARARMAAKLATAAYKVHDTQPGTRRRGRAVRRYHHRLRVASVRMGFATNTEMIDEVRLHLDALYSSITGTAPGAVADLNVWQAAGLVDYDQPILPVPQIDRLPDPKPLPEFTVRPARLGPVRRIKRTARLAGRTRGPKPAQAPTAPEPAPVPPPHVEYPAPVRDWEREMALQMPAISPQSVPADVKRPATVTQQTKPRTSVARTSRRGKAPASAEDLQAAARAYWETERSAGRDVSARQIAAAVGASKSSVSRWSQTWTESA